MGALSVGESPKCTDEPSCALSVGPSHSSESSPVIVSHPDGTPYLAGHMVYRDENRYYIAYTGAVLFNPPCRIVEEVVLTLGTDFALTGTSLRYYKRTIYEDGSKCYRHLDTLTR